MKQNTIDDLKIGEILRPVGTEENARREKKVRKHFWRTMRKAARHVPFVEDVVTAYFAALDNRTPLRVRGTLLAAMAYFVMPIDLIPDFIAVFGFTDDVAVLTAAIAAIQAHIRPAHREMAREALASELNEPNS